jgi:hypothetical protein
MKIQQVLGAVASRKIALNLVRGCVDVSRCGASSKVLVRREVSAWDLELPEKCRNVKTVSDDETVLTSERIGR